MSLPLHRLVGAVRTLFSDVDGTLTSHGRIESATLEWLEKLASARIEIILVTGRPAGWGQALMAMTPARAIVTENGGVTFVRRGARLDKIYGIPAATLSDWQRHIRAAAARVMAAVPGAHLSSDSPYREVDLAIDWNEEASLSRGDADRVVEFLRQAGFRAMRSSVHVNFGPPDVDKFGACAYLLSDVLGGDASDLSPHVFVGDALNDASMFGGFPRSVGVANVRDVWDELEHRPRYVTKSREAAGFAELAVRLLELGAG